MWKDSIRNIVVIFQPNILRTVGFYVRHSAIDIMFKETLLPSVEQLLLCGFLREPIYLVVQCGGPWWGGRYSTATLCNSTNTEWPR